MNLPKDDYPSPYWGETDFGLIVDGQLHMRRGWNEAKEMCINNNWDWHNLQEVVTVVPNTK